MRKTADDLESLVKMLPYLDKRVYRKTAKKKQKKVHWTKRPENRDRVISIMKKMVRAKKANNS